MVVRIDQAQAVGFALMIGSVIIALVWVVIFLAIIIDKLDRLPKDRSSR